MVQWLEQQNRGLFCETGTFSMHSENARRLAGLPPLELSDVPLLLMAAACEGHSSYFRLSGRNSCCLSWNGEAGESYEMALDVLRTEGVDFDSPSRFSVELPQIFWDFLGPFQDRCRHSPLSVIQGERVLWSNQPGFGIWSCPSDPPRLVLVDRGVDFELPFALPGRKIVVRTASALLGNPWPVRLVFNQRVRDLLLPILT